MGQKINSLEQSLEEYSETEKKVEETIEETIEETTTEVVEVKTVAKNKKEMLYDKIPISLKALDIIITISISLLVIMIVYFVIRKYS